MLDSWTVPAWVDRILSEIASMPCAKICLVILNRESIQRGPLVQRAFRRWRHVLFKTYERVDPRIMRLKPDAHAPVNVHERHSSVPSMDVVPQRKGYTHRFSIADIETIRQHRLDVILRFGFNILRGDILNCAQYGIWSYHHGDNREYRGGPPMFWEMYDRRAVTGTILQILTEELDAGKVIYRSHAATDLISYCRNRHQSYWKATSFVGRRLLDLHRKGFQSLIDLETYQEPPARRRPILHAPANGVMCRFLLRTGARMLRNQVQHHLFHNEWFLGLKRGAVWADAPWEIIRAPRGRFYADPFIVRDGQHHHVFFEDCTLGRADGAINCLTLDQKGDPGPARRVLQRPYHLSYPCVFQWEDQWYMIPESSQNRTIELYRASRFPDQWVLERVLMHDVNAVDTTVFMHDGQFWMMCAMSECGGGINDELFLFFSASPLGRLVAHPCNPIVSDVRCARPAGIPYVQSSALIRPGQDCSEEYGRAIRLNVVEELNARRYRERPIGSIEPRELPGCSGTHTINSTGDWTVTDGRQVRFKLK